MLVIVLALAAATCAGGEEEAAARALAYLRTTDHETGVDVLVAVEIYGELAGDPGAAGVVRAALSRVRAPELTRYGALLGRSKPAFPPGHPQRPPRPAGERSGEEEPDEDLARNCPLEVLSCATSEACLEFAWQEGSGKVLTHQALWLLLGRWSGCELPVDTESLRQRYAASLLEEARADPRPSDLFFERLAILGHLGYASAFEPSWIEALRRSQQPEGCFPADETVRCHPHPTALALWVLGHRAAAQRPP